MPFPFEKLYVYQRALAFTESIDNLCKSLKGSISYPFINQLTRAALSIPLNIAEGNGRWHKKEKRNFFWIARGSVFEIVPIVQLIHRKQLITLSMYQDLYDELRAIAKMLTKLIQSVDNIQNENRSIS